MTFTAADGALLLNIVVLLSLVIVLGLLYFNVSEANQAQQSAATTRELAQELRQSSDDLTRFVRTFTVTGNASYWDYFLEVLDIRDGAGAKNGKTNTLPEQPWRNWWDLKIATGHEPRLRGRPHAIADRFREAGFTETELALLDKAKRESDALVDLEDVASHAMAGKYRPDEGTPGFGAMTAAERKAFSVSKAPNQTLAMQLVHSLAYHADKGKIMRPLDLFAAASSKRVDEQLEDITRLNIVLLSLLSLSIVVMLINTILYIVKLRSDAETRALLNTMLPAHVLQHVSVEMVQAIKATAHRQAKEIRRAVREANTADAMVDAAAAYGVLQHRRPAPASPGVAFPVLFAEALPAAWLAFCDVANFTVLCRHLSCASVMSMLNELFALIDANAERCRVLKIKNIGDACMMASIPDLSGDGTSDSDKKHIAAAGIALVRWALQTFETVRAIEIPLYEYAAAEGEDLPRDLEMRCGIHCGNVASGIVGTERLQFDLIGENVNAAARLEANGEPGAICMLKSALEHFGNENCRIELMELAEPRMRDLKGIGLMETVLISGLVMGTNSTMDSASRATLGRSYSGLTSASEFNRRMQERVAKTSPPSATPYHPEISGNSSSNVASLPGSTE